MLDSHSEIFSKGEFYLNEFRRWWKKAGEEEEIGELSFDPIKKLEESISKHKGGWFFFEMKTWHPRLLRMSIANFVEESKKLGIKKHIVLERQNRLRIIVSILVAHKNNHNYHRRSSESLDGPTRVKVPISEKIKADFKNQTLKEFLGDYDREIKELRAALDDDYFESLNLTYERHVKSDPSIAFNKIIDFLKVPSSDVKVDLGKTNPYPLKKIVSNYDSLKKYLKDTKWEHMLYD